MFTVTISASEVYLRKEGLSIGFEQEALAAIASPTKIFWRYVDETFIVVKRNNLNEFYHHLNDFDSHIQFSMELESISGTLTFLDFMTHKNGYKLRTTIYQEPSGSGTILAYSSPHLKAVYASITSSVFIGLGPCAPKKWIV